MGTQKNGLNEMVLLSTQNIYTDGLENIYNFTLKKFAYLKPMDPQFHTLVYCWK